jgi:hypothetical protein
LGGERAIRYSFLLKIYSVIFAEKSLRSTAAFSAKPHYIFNKKAVTTIPTAKEQLQIN